MKTVSILFARTDSIYKEMPQCDVWDKDRDATKYAGDLPVVAHPPCRLWGVLRWTVKQLSEGEKETERNFARFSVDTVRRVGGVLEHPSTSRLWLDKQLPAPGKGVDQWGGWTLPVRQFDFGHPAEKKTFLYICGVGPGDTADIPLRFEQPRYVVTTNLRKPELEKRGLKRLTTTRQREQTPPAFAKWLVELAERCGR